MHFCPDFFVMKENGTLRLISKFMTSETGKLMITIQILPNISRINDNQIMKFVKNYEYSETFLKEKAIQSKDNEAMNEIWSVNRI